MKNNNFFIYMLFISILIITPLYAEQKNELTIYQVMQRVLDRYPSLKIVDLEVEQAAEQRQQVESSLGWILNSTAGISHDVTAFGTPSDILDVNGSIDRQLKSGSILSLSGGYRYEDSSLTFSPLLPNPAHTTKLDLSYRMPLAQGEGNPIYNEGLISAEAEHDLAKANQLLTRITLAEKVKDLFYSSAITTARLVNAKQAVLRTKKLKAYINKNFKLGLSEEKDKLQINAQLQSKLAELSEIQLQWQQQKTSLNRLMIEDWNQNIQPKLVSDKNNTQYMLHDLISSTTAYHPAVKISQAKLQIAESQITSTRDSKKDNLDLIVSVGTRTSDGDNATSTVSEHDWAGAVRLEYRHLFDDSGVSSKYKQAQLQKNIALQDMKITNNDIRYTVSSLVAEIEAARLAVLTSEQQLKSEALKLKEAEHRFKTGRTDTAQLIQFQNEYSFSELAYQKQKINLKNIIVALQIFTGQFWNKLAASPIRTGVER